MKPQVFDKYGIELSTGDNVQLDGLNEVLSVDEIIIPGSYIVYKDGSVDDTIILYNKKLNIHFYPEDCEKWIDDPLKFRKNIPI